MPSAARAAPAYMSRMAVITVRGTGRPAASPAGVAAAGVLLG